MSLAAWIMLVCHISLFLYLRLKYIKKKMKLEKENSVYSVENMKLKEENKILNEAIENLYGDTHE